MKKRVHGRESKSHVVDYNSAYVSAAFVGGVTHHVIGMQLKLIIEDESLLPSVCVGMVFFNPHSAKTMPTDGKPCIMINGDGLTLYSAPPCPLLPAYSKKLRHDSLKFTRLIVFLKIISKKIGYRMHDN